MRSYCSCSYLHERCTLQGETKILKLKNLRPQDYAQYTCIASVRQVCGIADKSALFNLNNRTGIGSANRHTLSWNLECFYELIKSILLAFKVIRIITIKENTVIMRMNIHHSKYKLFFY